MLGSVLVSGGGALRAIALLAVCTVTFGMAGCDGGAAGDVSLFKRQWQKASESKDHEALFEMLDAGSRRAMGQQLQTLRGLDAAQREKVSQLLGVSDLKSLDDLEASRYFAFFWQRVTGGKEPVMNVEPQGEGRYRMVLELNGKAEQYELVDEGGQWRWTLPKQEFGLRDSQP